MTTSDPTPGDHDELIAPDGFRRRYNLHYSELVEYGANETGRHVAALDRLQADVATALRTEQSARQALQGRLTKVQNIGQREVMDALEKARRAHIRSSGRSPGITTGLQLRQADRIVLLINEALTTESKEPAPKLDPEPWIMHGQPGSPRFGVKHSDRWGTTKFSPRPEFSQNKADYGIEVPHD